MWLVELHGTIQMKSNHKWINYKHDNIAIRSHIMIHNSVQNLFFATKFSSIYLTKGERCLFFRLSFVNLQRAKDGTIVFDAKYRYVFVVWMSSNRKLGITPHYLLFQMNVYRVTRKGYSIWYQKWNSTQFFISLGDFLCLYYSEFTYNFI